jgi:bifunctional DNA-binding transcriptional regulator/antitoxin component of YhaV-PrlF toxin-antitoxin module
MQPRIDLSVERRRCLGLPQQVLEATGIRPGDRVRVQVKDNGHIDVIKVVTLLDKFRGAVPGLTATTDLGELRRT